MLTTDRTNYNRIGQAQAFYKGRGYQNVETPWLVTPQAVRATLPVPKVMMETVRGVLVGSGEQSFIQHMMDGTLEPGMYQTTTPCFYDIADHHSPKYMGASEDRPYSMQVELLIYKPNDVRTYYEKILNDAMACLFEISDVDTFDASQTDEGFDIAFQGIVLGSFGVRQMGDHLWIYGTGLIEPRFSQALHTLTQEPETQPEASVAPQEASEEVPQEPVEPPPTPKLMLVKD